MYQIRKGWPCEGAIDETLKAAPGQTITNGMVVSITGGKASPANYTGAAADTDPVPAFIIGVEKVRGALTGLMSHCVIEVDKEHYAAGSYTAGEFLTAKAGKFDKAGTSKKVARVLSFDSVSGLLRVLWLPSC